MALRLIFMGTPAFSVPVLDRLIAAGHEIVAVYSQPPRKAGRGMADAKSSVHSRAEALGIPVLTPQSFKSETERDAFHSHNADVAVVVAYGLILPVAILDAPALGCFNVHASLLPRWRGAAPIQRAIMAGDSVTGVTIMRMEPGLDTGPMCLAAEIPIAAHTTADVLHDTLSAVGADLMCDALARLEAGTLTATPQPAHGVTYAAKIEKSESRLSFAQPAAAVVRHIHGLSPFPGAWFEVRVDGIAERIKVLQAEVSVDPDLASRAHGSDAGTVISDVPDIACTDGAIRLLKVQRAGKRAVSASEFMRGFDLPVGTRIG